MQYSMFLNVLVCKTVEHYFSPYDSNIFFSEKRKIFDTRIQLCVSFLAVSYIFTYFCICPWCVCMARVRACVCMRACVCVTVTATGWC